MMSAVFYFQPTLNRSFNNCIELHQFWISSVVLLEIWRKRGIRGWWGVGQKKLLSKSSALLGLNSVTNVFILLCELYRFVRILSWLRQFYRRCENIAIVKILSPLWGFYYHCENFYLLDHPNALKLNDAKYLPVG